MKLGLGLAGAMLTQENFRFARQVGATHIVAHLNDYTVIGRVPSREEVVPPLWTEQQLADLKAAVEAEGLALAAIENFHPAHWSDVLLDGPRRDAQMADLKTIIRRLGKVGIPVMGYNFSIAGVWGHAHGPWARGNARTVGYVEGVSPPQTPIPHGTVWNMIVDLDAPAGDIGTVTSDQLWDRARRFLEEILPVAEEAGVRLAAHPDDPPLETVRGTARLVNRPELYQRLFDLVPSSANVAEFCQGTIAEMRGAFDVYEAIDRYAGQKKIGYVHFRNVRGKVPSYVETFVDEGDVDMVRCLRLYHKHQYDGVLIPDHTPSVECAAPWHAGMAYALGYMRAAITMVQAGG